MPKKNQNKSISYTLPPKKEESTTITIRVPRSLKERLDKFAEDNGYTSSELVKNTIEQFLNAMEA